MFPDRKPGGGSGADDRRGAGREDGSERRSETRERVIFPGLVLLDRSGGGHGVTILNRSPQGAKLRLGEAVVVPPRLVLLDLRAANAHLCRLCWSVSPTFGVRFEQSLLLSADSAAAAAQLRRLQDQLPH